MYFRIQLHLMLIATVTCSYVCNKPFWWAPTSLRNKVFMAIINNHYCYSWTTRHQFLKDPTGRSHLILPKGVPFSFYCGACFTRSSLKASLTAKMDNGDLTLVPIRGQIAGDTSCILSYGLTAPLTKNGKITCSLNRGANPIGEVITFRIRDKFLQKKEEEDVKELTTLPNQKVILPCPNGHSIPKENLIRVWHYTHTNETLTPESVIPIIPSAQDEITLRPAARDQHITCSVYDLTNPSSLYTMAYKVTGVGDEVEKEKWDAFEGVNDPHTQRKTPNHLPLIIGLILTGIALGSFTACFSLGICKCKRVRRREPSSSAFTETNKLSLLPQHHQGGK